MVSSRANTRRSTRANACALLGEKIGAEQAQAWGMIWKVVEDADLASEAQTLAQHFASQPTRALAMTKQALEATWHNTLDQQLDLERDLQREAALSPDYREGVAAFMAKRKPNFTGE